MSDEMEIMREFEKELSAIFIKHGHDAYYHAMLKDINPAVKREICRVLDELIMCMPVSAKEERETIYLHLQKYSPAPQHCEGMQEAIKEDIIEKTDFGWWIIRKDCRGRHRKKIYRCPFCEEGKNCIGGNG